MRPKFKTILVWVSLIVVFIVLFQALQSGKPSYREEYGVFLAHVEQDRVAGIRVNNNEITVKLHGGIRYSVLGVVDDELSKKLSERGVIIAWGEESNWLRTVLIVGVPLLLLLAVLVYFVRKSQDTTGNIMTLRKSRARLLAEESQVTFADVGGCEDAKELLGDVIDFLKNPDRWTEAGARLPRGVLLEGPPGSGKTLLARAVAGETHARFYYVSASEFVEMFVGVGASRVRDMFETAAKKAPAVIFIDELDAVGRRRGSGVGAGHDEREQTLNQLLVCLDGFEEKAQVVVIGATNRVDVLDQALLRPGRFDRRIKIPPLSRDARLQTFQIHMQNKQTDDSISLEDLADRMVGFNGAEIESLCNEATLLAVRRTRQGKGESPRICEQDFINALKPGGATSRLFDKLDSVLIESTTQLSEPTGKAMVRLTLRDHDPVEGEVVWADATFIKVRTSDSGNGTIVPKLQVQKIEALDGTETAKKQDVIPDRWSGQQPDLA